MTIACLLGSLVGREAVCPGEPCPFWRAGDGCAFEESGHQLGGRPDVAALLIGVRDRLTAEQDALDSRRLTAFAHELDKTAQHDLA